MKLLADTHVLLWWLADDSRLSRRARDLMAKGSNEISVSVISLWEIALKTSKGKSDVSLSDVQDAIEDNGFPVISVLPRHVDAYARLPLHHRDPFDRMLLAQAASESLRLLTQDAVLSSYGDIVEFV